ncbi:strumpellin and WASH-interacting protein isoform X2 [Lycorma delicatula]
MISRLLPTLQDLVAFISRLNVLLIHIIQQLAAFYSLRGETPKLLAVTEIHLQDIMDCIGDILLLLVMFDELFANQTCLTEHWTRYRHSVEAAVQDPSGLGVDSNNIKRLEKLLDSIHSSLFSSKCFHKMLHSPFEKRGPVKKNNVLAEKMIMFIKNGLYEFESKQPDMEVMLTWTKLCSMYVLSANLFGTADKKLFRHLWELSRKHPGVIFFGNILWFPDKFFMKHLSHITKQVIDKKSIEAVAIARRNFLIQIPKLLPKEVIAFSSQVCLWMEHFELSLREDLNNVVLERMKEICRLLLEGIQLISRMKRIITLLINLHPVMGKPMTKGTVIVVCKLVELIKGIEMMYHRHSITISKCLSPIMERLLYQTLLIIDSTKKAVVQDKRYNEKLVDVLSSLVMAEKALDGPPTRMRLLISRLALSIANWQHTFREEDFINLSQVLTCVGNMASLQEILSSSSNCDFFYWNRNFLTVYLSKLYEAKADLQRLIYVINAVQDSENSISNTKHLLSTKVILDSLDKEITQYLKNQLIGPLCQEIETNLRLLIHSHLQIEEHSLKNISTDCSSVLQIQPFFLISRYIFLKGRVEGYLERTFYDLTTVALHDWRTYGEMRSLARHKYDLSTVEDHLPSQTLEQGLDVLEIMRNIDIFVSRYMYNLNNQIFIEFSSNNKHLNTINIRHIANSIRTHGTGIMNTTVNVTYQFLRKKLDIFSQFLYDDHIKSKLLKELSFFQENKSKLDSKYPYDRADKFNKDIRVLGEIDGLSYLDKFRLLITQIGNAMGYVRMIRSGGLHCCSNAICFVPEIENILKFEDLVAEENFSDSCREAAKSLDHFISNMARNLTEGTEYFKLLLDVISPAFRNPKNCHLRNFHMIVPALTINFCENLVTAKEKMSKKTKDGAAFTDDGFAMGVAYMLKVIDLNSEFDSLHWFQSVQDTYHYRKMKNKQRKDDSTDDKLQQTLSLTLKRLETYHQEFDLLYYSLSSARIFFQRDTETNDIETKKLPQDEV